MERIINGKKLDVEIIGGFEIQDLEKSYVLCSYDDDENSEEAFVVIMEVVNNEDGMNLVSIPDDEMDAVLAFYQSMKKALLEDE